MKVPYVDIKARYRHVNVKLVQAAAEVISSGRFIGGEAVSQLENKMAVRFGGQGGVGVASGTDALILSLQALGVSPSDEVIVPAVSFFSTAGAVLRIGAVPVVVDVLPGMPVIDPLKVKQAITKKTRAIVPVHLFGHFAELPDFGIPIVDDAAQAVGGRPPRFQGEFAAISFYPTKVLGAIGDGGMIIGRDAESIQRARRLANHGMSEPHVHEMIMGHAGTNSRLDAVQAAMLNVLSDRLDEVLQIRYRLAMRYNNAFPQLAMPLSSGTPVGVYTIRHVQRDRLRALLADRGVGTSVYYPMSLAAQKCIPKRFPTPNADRFCQEALALPCYEGIEDEQVEWVIHSLKDALEQL